MKILAKTNKKDCVTFSDWFQAEGSVPHRLAIYPPTGLPFTLGPNPPSLRSEEEKKVVKWIP